MKIRTVRAVSTVSIPLSPLYHANIAVPKH